MPEYRGAWIFAQLAMRRRAGMSEARAVHITDPNALCPLRGRALLTTVYDLIPLRQGISRRSVLNRLGYATYLNALRRADVMFAISDETAGEMASLLEMSRDRIVVARPGIDLPPSAPQAPASRPYFLFIGGPNPNKNLGVVLDAMGLCADLGEELVVAGRWLPKQVDALQAELRSRGLSDRVRHVGFVAEENLVPLIRGSTALLVPSLSEGFGLPVGEGLAAGAVVVHSNIPVLEEVSSGVALSFDPHSPQELASCMKRVATDRGLRDSLRRSGLERAQELTWDAAIAATLDAYRAILAR